MGSLYESLMTAPQAQASSSPLWNGLTQPNAGPVFAQQAASQSGNVYSIGEGPEYNKWDEALQARGRIRIPKELDNPQEWLNAPHLKTFLKDVDREDLPDGSVILSRRGVPTS